MKFWWRRFSFFGIVANCHEVGRELIRLVGQQPFFFFVFVRISVGSEILFCELMDKIELIHLVAISSLLRYSLHKNCGLKVRC